MAEEQSKQSFGKNFILAVLVLGGTLMFLLFLGKAAMTNGSLTHHLNYPWP